MAQKTITKVTIEYSDGELTVITGSSSGSSTSPSVSTPKYTKVTKKDELIQYTDVHYYKYDTRKNQYFYIGKYERFVGYEKPSSSATMKQSDPEVIDSLVFRDSELNKNNWIQINKHYTKFEQVSDEDVQKLNLFTKDETGGGGRKRKSRSRRAAKSYQKQGRRKSGRKSRR
jgi:hypothetical protein